MGANLNAALSDIHVEIQRQDQLLLQSGSYLNIEADLNTKGDTYKPDNKQSFVNNGMIYLFDGLSSN